MSNEALNTVKPSGTSYSLHAITDHFPGVREMARSGTDYHFVGINKMIDLDSGNHFVNANKMVKHGFGSQCKIKRQSSPPCPRRRESSVFKTPNKINEVGK